MYIHGTGDAWARMLVGSAMMFTSTFLYLVLIINDTLELSEIQKQNICHFTEIVCVYEHGLFWEMVGGGSSCVSSWIVLWLFSHKYKTTACSSKDSALTDAPLLQTLHWLLVQTRIEYKLWAICLSFFSDSSPAYLLTFPQCTPLPGSFVLLQTHTYFASPMLDQKP